MAQYPNITETNSKEKALDPFRRVLSEDVIITSMDLRKEIASFNTNQGHWIVFRKFDKSRHSIYWDEKTKTASGGPAWEYTDHLIQARKSIASRNSSYSEMLPAGANDLALEFYYLTNDLNPTDEDLIIEIDPCAGSRPATYTIVQAKEILRVDPMREINGRIEFYQVVTNRKAPMGDSTLR